MKADYDVIIIGAGSAGIFTALELTSQNDLKVLLLEKGKDIEDRFCPARESECIRCKPCSIMTGWGGAGAFSDGKLNLSTSIGGWLDEYISESRLDSLIGYVDGIYQRFGAPNETFGYDKKKIAEIRQRAVKADLIVVPTRVKHLGTEYCREILKKMKEELENKVEIRTSVQVEQILTENGRATGVLTSKGKRFIAKTVVVAPGREGAEWLVSEAARLGLSLRNNAVDIGLRVEVPAPVMEPLTDYLYEAKLIYYSKSFEDKVRTFCMNPYGRVSTEMYGEVMTVNGHSYAMRKTDNTNFALLVSTSFTEPFKDPIAYGKYIARLANLLGGGIIVQRLGDLQAGRRSTPERIKRGTVKPTLKNATPGDLSFVLPYRYLFDILEMLEAMDKIVPGVGSKNTLLYGVEVKFYSSRLKLKPSLEAEIASLYAIGDGAGISRGLVQSSVSGVIAARSILNVLKVSKTSRDKMVSRKSH